jgi:recombination protein RecA
MYGEGISKEGDLIDAAAERGILEKSGSWFSFAGERIGQGRENAKQFLRDNPDLRKKLEIEVRKALNLGVPPEPEAAEDAGPARGKK